MHKVFRRKRKLSLSDRKMIITLYQTKEYTMKKLGEKFGVSASRVSQLVNDNYDELSAIFKE